MSKMNATINFIVILPSQSSVVNGELIRMTAPNITSETGVKLAGLTYDGTTNGIPVGKKESEIVIGNVSEMKENDELIHQSDTVRAVYTFEVAPASAILLSIPFSNTLSDMKLKSN